MRQRRARTVEIGSWDRDEDGAALTLTDDREGFWTIIAHREGTYHLAHRPEAYWDDERCYLDGEVNLDDYVNSSEVYAATKKEARKKLVALMEEVGAVAAKPRKLRREPPKGMAPSLPALPSLPPSPLDFEVSAIIPDVSRVVSDVEPGHPHHYKPLYRPASFATVPKGWVYIEAPSYVTGRPDLPQSKHKHGVIGYDHPLSMTEVERFELEGV